MNLKLFENYKIKLASNSPRRRQLLADMGIKFDTISSDIDETYPDNLQPWEVAMYLCKKKSEAIDPNKMKDNEIVITADTIVSVEGSIIPKPASRDEAIQFLKLLSGCMHYVFTAVTIKNNYKNRTFISDSKVWFRKFSDDELAYYVDNFKPYDKAGAYGIQEWIGVVGVEHIEGSYFNIMGLPTATLYKELMEFISEY